MTTAIDPQLQRELDSWKEAGQSSRQSRDYTVRVGPFGGLKIDYAIQLFVRTQAIVRGKSKDINLTPMITFKQTVDPSQMDEDLLRLKRLLAKVESVIEGKRRGVDITLVNARIRDIVRPLLKQLGFTHLDPRSGWRFWDNRIDVVNFQSYNSYHALVLGCTTFSFSVNLGCFLTFVPRDAMQGPMKKKRDLLLPKEYECHFRGRLQPTIDQPGFEAKDIWSIDELGENLDRAIEDAKCALETKASPWFDQFAKLDDILRILMEANETDSLWGFGTPISPARCYLVGYVARELGNNALARDYLLRAAATPSYASSADRLRKDAGSAP
jgi:hypothetical protein